MGFSSAEDDELELEGIDATVTPLRQRNLSGEQDDETSVRDNVTQPDSEENHRNDSTVIAPSEDPSRPDASSIFDGVVEVFNGALPDFLQKSVDPEKQRQLLFESLDSSMKTYFDHLEKNVERRLNLRFQADTRKLHEQIEELRLKAQKEEEGNSNAKNLQLSAERQKRALSERVHELEKQLATIEAENEQYILENKSMANKLRLVSMSGDAEAVSQEFAERETALKNREQSIVEKEAVLSQKTAELESKLQEAETKLQESESLRQSAEEALKEAEQNVAEQVSSAVVSEETNQRVADLEKELAVMRDSLEQAKVKDELSCAMVNDLNAKAAEARATAEKFEEQFNASQTELKESAEQLALLTARLTKAQEDLQVVREVKEQVLKLEENQRINDAELRRQKDEILEKDELIRAKDADLLTKNTTLRIKDETIRRLEDQTDSLRKEVETAQFDKAQTESALRSEIERLKALKGISTQNVTESAQQLETIIEIPVDTETEGDIDLTLDLPELVAPEVVADSTPKPRRGRPPKPHSTVEDEPQPKRESAKEEDDDHDFSLLDSTDWLIATPPTDPHPKPKRQRKPKAESQDDAFGYKEPPRQEPPDNPAQMLLW